MKPSAKNCFKKILSAKFVMCFGINSQLTLFRKMYIVYVYHFLRPIYLLPIVIFLYSALTIKCQIDLILLLFFFYIQL